MPIPMPSRPREPRHFPSHTTWRTAVALILLCAASLSAPSPGTSLTLREKPLPSAGRRLTIRHMEQTGVNLAGAFRGSGVAKPAAESLPGVHRDKSTGVPVFIGRDALNELSRRSGKIAAGLSPFETALNLMEGNPGFFRLRNPRSELRVSREYRDSGGRLHLRCDQVHAGVPVQGSSLTLHFDADGGIYALSGRYVPTPGVTAETGDVTAAAASARAREYLSEKTAFQDPQSFPEISISPEPEPELVILPGDRDSTARLAWKVEIRPNLRERWLLFVDARTGGISEAWQDNPRQTVELTAAATDALGASRTIRVTRENGVYYLADLSANLYTYSAGGKVITRDEDVKLVSSPNNAWTNAIAVSAHANLRETYDYYLREHGRDGVDGNRMVLPVIVNYTEDGTSYYNAFWAGEFMAFGDGLPFAAALDVLAHEMTHGVTQFTVGLEYRFESGALNELFSDLMAACVDPDWLMGEDLPGGAIRDVLNPERYGLPAHMNQFRQLTIEEDNGGVHINVGIPSRACALLAEAIGRDKAADLFYHILDSRYLSPRARFSDLRLAMVQAATDLFGADSPEFAAVGPAFDAVGITSEDTARPSDDIPAPAGGEWIAYVEDGGLVLTRPEGQGEETIRPTSTMVYTGTACPVSIDRAGSMLVFVDSWNDLRMIDIETLDEYILDSSGEWSSIALSPDGSRLAATSIYADSTLYLFDFENPEWSKAVRLHTPGTEGSKSYTALYADALDWDPSGTHVIYDQFNRVPSADGAAAEFWNINTMEVEHEVIVNIQTSSNRSFQTGNPSFARTNDRYIVCDLLSDDTEYCAVTTVDLFTMETVEINRSGYHSAFGDPYPNLGIPRYAPDDRALIFQRLDTVSGQYAIYTIPLAADRMHAEGTAVPFVNGMIARWFVKSDGTGVADGDGELPSAIALGRNRPNPFNPSTVIPFTIHASTRVKLEVFDTLGQRVRVLVDGELPAGNHEAVFDGAGMGSGVYFYHLRAGAAESTGKMLLAK